MIVVMKARSNRDYNILNKITEAEKKPKIKKKKQVKYIQDWGKCMSLYVFNDSVNWFMKYILKYKQQGSVKRFKIQRLERRLKSSKNLKQTDNFVN